MIAFKLACYASALGQVEEAKVRLRHAIGLDKNIRRLALEDEDMRDGLGSPPYSFGSSVAFGAYRGPGRSGTQPDAKPGFVATRERPAGSNSGR